MLMTEWIRENLVEPAKERRREEGREEARAELMAEFEDWDTRRRAAEERGESFDEPPPYARNGAYDNHN